MSDADVTLGARFDDLGVPAAVVAALHERGVERAFPIQEAVIAAALDGRDICGKAPTGSGKTLAFGIPTIALARPGEPWRPSALILSPTRELASQIKEELEPLAAARSRRVLTVFGGTNIERDIKQLERGVDVLVACPGRLEDLISRRCVELRDAAIVVVDEADRMADMGFLPSVKRILDQTPDDRHTLLFSATLDGDVDALINRYQRDPLTFEVDEPLEASGDVEHSWHLVVNTERLDAAATILRSYWSSIVFCRTRRGCDRVAKMLGKRGLSTVAIHGDRSQAQRERALKAFTDGSAQVLVATDVAARGIHVDDVSLVLHYDPAGSDKDYVHRSGRTGRAGRDGRVISLVVGDKEKVARELQRDLGVKVGFEPLDLEAFRAASPATGDEARAKPEQKPVGDQQGGREGTLAGGGKARTDRDDRSGNRKRRDGNKNRNANRSSRSRNRTDRDNDRNDKNRNNRGSRNRTDRDNDRNDKNRNNRGSRNRRDGGTERRTGRGAGNRNDRNTRDGDRDERQRSGQQRRRRASNDWYPPGWDDDEQRPGGSNTTQRKRRADKGRHADRNSTKNKGRRRSRP